ncbi:hypothetical protein BJF79_30520 [Actinomadura sp. CNU-125]|nr:hypothetical protein BJF79_30520 [Actinomadura sp. CNU-125]
MEAAADGISTYQVQRNAADVPKARVWNATWEDLSADGAPVKERVLAAARLDPDAVTLLACTFPDGTEPAQAIAWLQAAAPDAQTHMAPDVPLGELLRTVIADEPLTQLYELATIVPDPDGTLRFKGRMLFTVDARRHDTVQLDLRFHQTDELGAALAVISWSQRRFRLVSVQRANVPPGRYEVIAELERPGRVRFHGLPTEPVRDDRTWDELVAAVPDRLPPAPPDVHLVCAIETAGPPEQVAALLDRAGQFVRSAAAGGAPGLAVSLIAYGPHAFVRRPPPAVKVLADRRSADDALRVLDALRDREPAGDPGYPHAAAVECALAEAGRLIAAAARRHRAAADRRPAAATRRRPRVGGPAVPRRGGLAGRAAHAAPPSRPRRRRRHRPSRAPRRPVLEAARRGRPRRAGRGGRAGPRRPARPRPRRTAARPLPVRRDPLTPTGPRMERTRAWQPRGNCPPPDHNIAMWGATGSGKTTFLAALDVALNLADDVDWRVIGANEASTDVLVDLSGTLTNKSVFPDRTEGLEQYQWRLIGETVHREGRPWNRRTVRRAHTIGLDIHDAAGEWFSNDFMGDREPMLESLAKSRGLVYLFDPIREFKVGDAYKSFDGMLARLAERILNAEDAPADGRLPHHVAVCTTKFDEVRVLQTAEHLGLLDYDADEYGFPRVPGDEERGNCSANCARCRRPAPRTSSGVSSAATSARTGSSSSRRPRSGSTWIRASAGSTGATSRTSSRTTSRPAGSGSARASAPST